MRKRLLYIESILIVFILSAGSLYAQETDIVPYLKQIESGNKQEVRKELPTLLKKYPKDPSVMFLQGVLTDDGQKAEQIYTAIWKNYPSSRYADASVYRLYNYYYSLGIYSKARNFLDVLKVEYPQSPYLSIARKNIPDKNSVIAAVKTDKSELKDSAKNNPEEDYKYTIQAGAFSVADNAASLMKEFKNAGYFSIVEDKSVAGTNFHVVYTGKFVNEEDARNFLKQLDSKYNINGVVVKFDSIRDK